MAKEDFSLKKDVLQLQKKMTDFELTATELKEAVTKFDTAVLDELKQRVDDIEDLTMVENAAVIELKNMLEGSKPEQPAIPEEVTNRLNTLEEKIASIPPPVETPQVEAAPQIDTSQIDELKTNFETLKTGIEGKIAELHTTAPNMDVIGNEIRREINRSIDWLKNEVTAIVEERSTSLEKSVAVMNEKLISFPSPDELRSIVDGLTNSFKAFRSSIETRFQTEESKLEQRWSEIDGKVSFSQDLMKTVEEFRHDMKMKKEAVDNMISSLEEKLRMPMHERAVRELEKIRNDWIINNARVDTIETLVKTFNKQIEGIKPAMKKMETFDKLIDLHKEIVETSEEMKVHFDEVKRIDDKIKKIDIRKEIRKLEGEIEALHVDKNFDVIEASIKNLQNDMSVFQGSVMALEQNKLDTTAAIGELQETKASMQERFDHNESSMSSLKKELAKSRDEISEAYKKVGEFEGDVDNLSSLKQEVSKIKGDLAHVLKKQPDSRISEVVKRTDSIEADVAALKSLKPDDSSGELMQRLEEMDNKIDAVRVSSVFDQHMSEIVSRLVFLESRIAAMEGMVQDMPRYSPIVVE